MIKFLIKKKTTTSNSPLHKLQRKDIKPKLNEGMSERWLNDKYMCQKWLSLSPKFEITERANHLLAEIWNIWSIFFPLVFLFLQQRAVDILNGLNLRIEHGILYTTYEMRSCDHCDLRSSHPRKQGKKTANMSIGLSIC